jgi:hypothetical protein
MHAGPSFAELGRSEGFTHPTIYACGSLLFLPIGIHGKVVRSNKYLHLYSSFGPMETYVLVPPH